MTSNDDVVALAATERGVLIEKSKEISSRIDFARLCNERGYIDAIEIGVDREGICPRVSGSVDRPHVLGRRYLGFISRYALAT